VAPLRLGGLRGKKSTPSVWLGGTGELSTVGKRDAARSAGRGTERGTSIEVRTAVKQAKRGKGMVTDLIK
jgi:hypothetical protein